MCFRYNEKYSSDHKFEIKDERELQIFFANSENEEFEIIEDDEMEKKELNTIEVIEEGSAYVELSINSMVRLNDPGTMKMKGKIQGREVVVLIDCKATHNFISEKLVKGLQLSTKETFYYGVILNYGTAIKGKGIYEAVEVTLNEWTILELRGVHIILGMHWLYSLGVTEVD